MMNTINFRKPLISLFGIVVLFSLALTGCKTSDRESSAIKTPELKVETFPTDSGWGYNILAGEKIVIRQEIIPAVQKNEAFQSSDDAKKVAALVVKKLKSGDLPSVTPVEIDSLLSR